MGNSFGPSVRAFRVGLALALTAALSLVDLVLTSYMATHGGMFEVNPIARVLMRELGATWPLAGFKLATLAVATGILYRVRCRWQGELGAWAAAAILVGVLINWGVYLGELGSVDAAEVRRLFSQDPHWVGTLHRASSEMTRDSARRIPG
jgi:hypothetical protein